MATFNPVVRTNKEFSTVYILISHKSKSDYIKTGMQIHESGIKDGKIVDYLILANCAILIKKYIDRMNEINSENMSVQEIRKFLTNDSKQISFVKFANAWIDKMEVAGRKQSAANYRAALHSLMGFCGKKELMFSDITSIVIRKWIESLSETRRAKQMYPKAIKKMFEDGCLEYNDYDNNIIKVKNQPFRAVKIPFADVPDKRSVEATVIREILKVSPETAREELAHDIVLLAFSLAGINAVDLYELPLSALSDGKIKYNRSKTKSKRKDKAYFEILLPESLIPILEKHKGRKRLFNFSERYAEVGNFSQNVNKGLKSLCEKAGTQKITVYWLRHTWATIALNKCGATIEQVAFCLNHSSAHKITETYITKEFSIVDEINRRVCEYVFEERNQNC
jgi:site-specific recombinase XerD